MKQNHILLKFSILPPEEQIWIKEAVRLLIHIFWSQGGGKDWTALVSRSEEVWKSLSFISELETQDIVNTVSNLLQNCTPESLEQELESEFIRIFVNTRKGVDAPLYHSCYYDDNNLLMREPATEMSEFLEAAGMDLSPEIGEPPDHLCIELEYLYFLLTQDHALKDPEFSEHTRSYAQDFMLPWIDEFQSRIPETSPAQFFSQTALIMKNLITFLGKTD